MPSSHVAGTLKHGRVKEGRVRRDGGMGPFPYGVEHGTPAVAVTREGHGATNTAVLGSHPTGFGLRNGSGVIFASAMPQRQAELEQLVANLQASRDTEPPCHAAVLMLVASTSCTAGCCLRGMNR
jgi:hypothetical protein